MLKALSVLGHCGPMCLLKYALYAHCVSAQFINMRFAFVYEQRPQERIIAFQASSLFKTLGCFTKPLLYPEINNKLLVHILLHKSEGKPPESLLRATVPLFDFFHGGKGYRRVDR